MTRTSVAKRGQKQLAAGRPLGFLLAWLQHSDVPTRAEHWDKSTWKYPLEERLALRRAMLDTTSGRQLADFERPKRTGEDSEPEVLEGLVS